MTSGRSSSAVSSSGWSRSNRFIDDVYNEQRVIADGVFPIELLAGSANYRTQCRGVHPKFGVWAHISGSDLVRDDDGEMYVLEDNLRVPSGVSYVLENRAVAKRVFAEVFQQQNIRPVDAYTDELNKLLSSLAPDGVTEPQIVVLTPGVFNSAYFEHSFLAQRIGAELVEGADLVVGDDECVYMRTITGLERVARHLPPDRRPVPRSRGRSVLIRRLGVPGLMRAWKAGNVGIANAPGAGVADDKVVYAWVPDLIRYYLDEEPLIPNVPTYRCLYDDELRFVVANIGDLVVKPANESGGYGILIGNRATATELADAIEAIRGRSAQLGRATDHLAVDRADHRRRSARAAPRRPAAVHPDRRAQLRDGRRADTGRADEGIARRELVAGWRQQGHLDPRPAGGRRRLTWRCCHGSPTGCTGVPATSSGPRTRHGSCARTPT